MSYYDDDDLDSGGVASGVIDEAADEDEDKDGDTDDGDSGDDADAADTDDDKWE
ncbi:MAG: hypothetical protein NUV59_02265 [Patescibacteria group bacterium]|nr:hypothetical protein [Patescibacteria group bacterium]